MSNEKTKADYVNDIENAKQAELILNHPLFIASLGVLRDLTVDKFESLKFSQTQEMQECNIRLRLIEEFEDNLCSVIQNGNTSYDVLEDIQTFEREMNNER